MTIAHESNIPHVFRKSEGKSHWNAIIEDLSWQGRNSAKSTIAFRQCNVSKSDYTICYSFQSLIVEVYTKYLKKTMQLEATVGRQIISEFWKVAYGWICENWDKTTFD